MGWWILTKFNIRQSMLKLKTHSGFHDIFLNYKIGFGVYFVALEHSTV
jgi:hypothetical protein